MSKLFQYGGILASIVLTLRVLRVFSKQEQTDTKPAVAPGEVALTS